METSADNCDPKLLAKAQERIKALEGILAGEIGESSKLLKENQILKTELETTRHQRDVWRRYYEDLKGEPKIQCDREEAMAVFAMPSTPE